MPDTLTITDNRTGKTYELPIEHDTIRAIDLRQIKVHDDDFGMMTYDPGYTNTASCKSTITYIDGDKGVPGVSRLSDRTARRKLNVHGSYVLAAQWRVADGNRNSRNGDRGIDMHAFVRESIKRKMEAFPYDAHPMGMLISTIGALSTFYPDAKDVIDSESRWRHIQRLIAKVPTLAAYTYRHTRGHPTTIRSKALNYTENFLTMMLKMPANDFTPDPRLVKALDVLFTLHADHEQNCSASVMRAIGSSESDPYSAVAGAAAALYGPLHGGANEARPSDVERNRRHQKRSRLCETLVKVEKSD